MKKIILCILALWLVLSALIFTVITNIDWGQVANTTGNIIGEVQNGIDEVTNKEQTK